MGRQPLAFVAHKECRISRRPQNQDGFLEPGVEPCEVKQAGAVLAVGIYNQPIVAALLGAQTQPLDPSGVCGLGNLRP